MGTYADVSESICKKLYKIVDPIYFKFNNVSNELKIRYFQGYAKNNDDDNDDDSGNEKLFTTFIDITLPILCSIGPGASNDTILLAKLIRICVAFLDYVLFAFK